MANEQNLLKGEDRHKFTLEEVSKGGKRSAESKRRRKAFTEIFEQFLNEQYTDKDGHKMTGAEALAMQVVKKGMKGDLKAFELIRDTVGEKPVDKIATVDIPEEVRNKVEDLVKDYESRTSV